MDYFTELLNEIDEKIEEYESNIEQNNNSILTIKEKIKKQYKERKLLQEKLNDLKSQEELFLHPLHTFKRNFFEQFHNHCAFFLYILIAISLAFVSMLIDPSKISLAITLAIIILPSREKMKKIYEILFCRDTKLKEVYQSIKTTKSIIKCVENEQMKLRFKQKDLNNQNKILMTHISGLEDKKAQLMFKKNQAFSRLMNHPTMKEYIKKIEESHGKMDELRSMQASYEEQFLNQEYENQSIEQELGVHLDLKQK